jgi:alkanesulfonate monooxygenase SsuD/methylene tetrahydromethanopterin reductase-like flavin-dependent oxidoreductase (luciferase family)
VPGITPNYFTPYGADFANRRALAAEAVGLLKTAFAAGGGRFSFAGGHHRYQDVTLSVLPQQRPHPPLWMPSRDPETLAFLAAEGVDTGSLLFVPREEGAPRYREYLRRWAAAGHARPPRIGYWALVYVDDTDERAVARATPEIRRVFGAFAGVDVPARASCSAPRRTCSGSPC